MFKDESQTRLLQLEKIVRKEKDRLFRFAYMRLGNREDAEDILQDVFLKLFRSEENLKHIGNLEHYLIRSVGNCCRDLQRKKKYNLLPIEDAGRITVPDEDRQMYVFNKADGRLMKMKIDAFIHGIPRTIVKLEGIDYDAAIAEAEMHIPENIEWIDMTADGRAVLADSLPWEEFTNITPESAVEKMFLALNTGDMARLGVIHHRHRLILHVRHLWRSLRPLQGQDARRKSKEIYHRA